VTSTQTSWIILSIVLIFLIGFVCNVMAATNEQTYQFETNLIENLRNQTGQAHGPKPYDLSIQVSPSTINFNKALQPYQHIHLKDGYRLDGFFLVKGVGSFSVPLVLPKDEPLILTYTNETPDGYINPPFIQYYAGISKTGRNLQIYDSEGEENSVIALPLHADRQIMNYFEGDDSPESYLEASVFQREIDAIDAGWHAGIGWPMEDVISYNYTPSVTLNRTHATVRITTTLTYCGSITTHQYEDTYTRPNMSCVSDIISISYEDDEWVGVCY